VEKIIPLVEGIKRQLKQQGLTYRDVAKALGLSEAAVKRMFASGRLGLDRLAELAAMMGLSVAELLAAAEQPTRLQALSAEQERQLVADPQLLLVAVCVLNGWTFNEIVRVYRLETPAVLAYLLQLDRLRLLDVLPGNRVRLRVARDFDWISRGPIQTFFLQSAAHSFIRSGFAAQEQLFAFAHGMLSSDAMLKMQAEVRKLRQRFAELHAESQALPFEQRHGCGLLLAMREWELDVFSEMRR
jgi:transcriptional regulator with XRE-family HTH domain